MTEAPETEAPDRVEEGQEQIENIIRTRGYETLPMVGLGGSAGSLGALQAFFGAMPPDSGMAFAVIVHLSPEHESTIPQMLQRSTTMRVMQAKDAEKVQANCVYVIPPGKHLSCTDGSLLLTSAEKTRGKPMAVDLFFRTLADTHGPHAVAIVLSGAGADGALGIKRIKEHGGLTIAQDPDEAEHSQMPRSAIATGMVDWVLNVAEMPQRLLEYRQNEERLKLPPPTPQPPNPPTPQPPNPPTPQPPNPPTPEAAGPTPDENETALRAVLTYLRTRTGHDFSYYKRATIVRRISRRLQVNGVGTVPAYLAFLRTHPGEAGALLQDLLISVTNFFRDHDSFQALEAALPRLFEGKATGEAVRVWVAGCATGEEAYSIAILLCEYASNLEAPPTIQVFATDLDDDIIRAARDGYYPETITADVADERLRRFFVKEHRGYRVRREVREVVLFAVHDLLKDAPFSRIDLVSCRNLLIYLNREAQGRALDILHFALHPGGRLFLGASESIEDASQAFAVIDKKHRLYERRPTSRPQLPVPSGPSLRALAQTAEQRAKDVPAIAGRNFAPPGPLPIEAMRAAPGPREPVISWGELHFRLIEQFAPPSMIVNEDYEIMHLSENAGRFLYFAGGEPTRSLLHVVHPMLRTELRATLFRAAQSGAPAEVFRVPVEIDGASGAVDIRVTPAQEVAPGFLLVVFDACAFTAGEGQREPSAPPEPATEHLERELEQVKSHLRDTVEQYEVSTEELKASNEELQAMNEELRAATEELETSREELQSINEELSTVNHELKSKVDELAHANGDLDNLMASTAIATVFLDCELRITRFTPSAVGIFRLIPGDIGRPLSDLQPPLDYPELAADARQVLEQLVPAEREVRGDDCWFLARMLPYHTTDDRIGGMVLTFVDITQRKETEANLAASEARLRALIESATEYAIFSLDAKRRVNYWNSGAQNIFGYTEQEIIGQAAEILFTPEDRRRGVPRKEMNAALAKGRAADDRWHLRKDGSRFYASGILTLVRGGEGHRFLKIARDLTAQKSAEGALRAAYERLEVSVQERTAELRTLNEELRRLSQKVLDTQETERRHLARELHDEVGQGLTALSMILDRCGRGSLAAIRAETAEARQVVGDLLERVREMSLNLRPHMLDDLGLVPAVQAHLKTCGIL